MMQLVTDFPLDLAAERTEWTEPMRGLVTRLVGRASAEMPGTRLIDGDTEVRVWVPARSALFAFLGQSLTAQAMTGAHPERVALWRDMGVPVVFVAVQGDIGWARTVTARTPIPVNINSARGGSRRVGWRAADMLKVAFTSAALLRHEGNAQPAVPWSWQVPAAPETAGLF